jgi:hypothetical protein
MDKPVYALSIKQPWAWLICKGFKDIENRDWKAPVKYYGERIYIHASLSKSEMTGDILGWIAERLNYGQKEALFAGMREGKVNLGFIIGEATLTACVAQSESPWFVGKYGFVMAEPLLYDKPIPCRGKLGFFKPDIKEAS